MNAKRIGDVLIESADAMVTATIDRPEVRNAINETVIAGLEAACAIAYEQRARVLLLRGAGGSFCAGADLTELESMRSTPDVATKFMARLGAVLDRLETAPFVVMGVIEGHAVAGGCELLLACDITIACSAARIGDGHLKYGLAPAAGGSVRLTRYLPKARSRYLLLSGELLSGDEAAAWGLVTFSVAPDLVEPTVATVVKALVRRSAGGIEVIKKMARNAEELPAAKAFDAERSLFINWLAAPDVDAGLTAFRERRMPTFGNPPAE